MMDAVKQTPVAMPNLPGDGSSKDRKLTQICAEFESLLIHYILKTGRATVPENGFLGNSHESQIYKSMMDEELAISVSRAKGMGLGALLYQQLGQQNQDEKHVSERA